MAYLGQTGTALVTVVETAAFVMTKKAFAKTKAGMTDALAYARGDRAGGRASVVRVPSINVRAARQKLGMSQDRFARTFRVSVATVRNWEQGRRRPEGPARALLRVIERAPKAVERALSR
jgi:putative transcriptional regulator